MSTVLDAPVTSPARPGSRVGRNVLLVVLVVLLVAVTAALAVRSAVRAERAAQFKALYQAQGLKAFGALEDQAAKKTGRDSQAVSDAAELVVPSVVDTSSMAFGTQQVRVTGDRVWMVFTGTASFTAPWWIGDQTMSVSTASYAQYTVTDSSVTSDAGGCVLESTGVDWARVDCTPEQRIAAGAA